MSKTCLVLEGGSMRGLFSAAILDTFLDEGIEVDELEKMFVRGYRKTLKKGE